MIRTTYILAAMFAVLFVINFVARKIVSFVWKNQHVIFVLNVVIPLAFVASFTCAIVAIALQVGIA